MKKDAFLISEKRPIAEDCYADHEPTQGTMKKILKALRETDPNIKSVDFWDM